MVEAIGFLPLREAGVPEFSVQAWSTPERWREDSHENPWYWRYDIVRSHRVCYGKFFRGHVGFIAKEYFPDFANVRMYSSPLTAEAEKILTLFAEGGEISSYELKLLTGILRFRDLDKILTELMRHGHLVISNFEYQMNRQGNPYGWPVGIYQRSSAFLGKPVSIPDPPDNSLAKLVARCAKYAPTAPAARIEKMLRFVQ